MLIAGFLVNHCGMWHTGFQVPTATGLIIEMWPLSRFKPYLKNPRKHDEQIIEQMAASIRAYGFKIPVLAKSTSELIDGHLRLKGAARAGLKEVPVILCDEWTDAQVKSFRLMANRSATWAEFDVGLLAGEMADLQDAGYNLALTGFDPEVLGRMIAGEVEDSGPAGNGNRNPDRDKMLHVVVYMQTLATFEEAIRLAGSTTRAGAVMEICRAFIAAKNAEVGGISLQ